MVIYAKKGASYAPFNMYFFAIGLFFRKPLRG